MGIPTSACNSLLNNLLAPGGTEPFSDCVTFGRLLRFKSESGNQGSLGLTTLPRESSPNSPSLHSTGGLPNS